VIEVPAFAALRGPQDPGPLGAGRAHRGQGVPAGDEDLKPCEFAVKGAPTRSRLRWRKRHP
jgi:hypothetical protein